MTIYWILYFLIKLDDIRNLLISEYGLSIFILFTCSFGILAYSIIFESMILEKDSEEITSTIISRAKKSAKYIIIVFIFQFVFNVIGIMLPSTGQAIAIYLGGKAYKSDVINELSNMDPDIAKVLRFKLNNWIKENLNEDVSEKN